MTTPKRLRGSVLFTVLIVVLFITLISSALLVQFEQV